jgi:hypothetical protein
MIPTVYWKRQPAYETWAALIGMMMIAAIVVLLQ